MRLSMEKRRDCQEAPGLRGEVETAKANGAKLKECLGKLKQVKAEVQALKAAKKEAESKKPAKGQLSTEDKKMYEATMAAWAAVTTNRTIVDKIRRFLQLKKGEGDVVAMVQNILTLSYTMELNKLEPPTSS